MSKIQALIDEVHAVAENIKEIGAVLNDSSGAFWDTQWFAALMGALVGAFIIFFMNLLKEYFGTRRQKLMEIYDELVRHKSWVAPKQLVSKAGITLYGHTMHEDGKTTKIPEKSISEKAIIELRKSYKYWRFPDGVIKRLFEQYENTLRELPSSSVKNIKKSPEYKKAQTAFDRISDFVEKQTGENQWTAR